MARSREAPRGLRRQILRLEFQGTRRLDSKEVATCRQAQAAAPRSFTTGPLATSELQHPAFAEG